MMSHPQSSVVRGGMWLRTLKVLLVLCVVVVRDVRHVTVHELHCTCT